MSTRSIFERIVGKSFAYERPKPRLSGMRPQESRHELFKVMSDPAELLTH
jgi:hypothetical protein